MVAALRWIQDEIGHFGGDKDNVTIFGESAGGTSVLMLMASPKANQLFQKVISQSPMGWQCQTIDQAMEFGAEYMDSIGAADLDQLQAFTAAEILTHDTATPAFTLSKNVVTTQATLISRDVFQIAYDGLRDCLWLQAPAWNLLMMPTPPVLPADTDAT